MLYQQGSIGLGILSWRGARSLAVSLKTYKDNDFFSLFDECMILLPDPDERVLQTAKKHIARIEIMQENLGILAGMEEIANRLKTDYIFFTENDNPLLENNSEARKQIKKALELLADNKAAVARMRHRQNPGEKFDIIAKYRRYFPKPDNVAARLRRISRPNKALRLAGACVYADENPDEKFPKIIKNAGGGFYLVDAKALAWTNQSIIIGREFFLNTIIPYCKKNPAKRRINGFLSIEIELNRSKFWTKSGWKIACAPGLLGHERIGDRGY